MVVIPVDGKKVFGTGGGIRIKGTIDGYPFAGMSLMPMKAGTRLLAIRAEIRKAIRKEAGQKITIILERDTAEPEVPEELKKAFEASPEAKKMFDSLSYSYKVNYAKPVTTAVNKATRERRAVDAVIKLERMYFEKHG